MKYLHIPILALILILLSSCEEVIDIDLNDSSPQIVIEAVIRDRPQGNVVLISQTTSYFEAEEKLPVSGAQVILRDEEGKEEVLTEIEPGFYPILNTQAKAGETYSLEVSYEGETYLANSTMLSPLPLDSVSFQERSGPLVIQEDALIAIVHLKDPPGEVDYILFETLINGELQPNLFLYNGRNSDGAHARVPFIGLEISQGDQVKINSYVIDETTFEYYNTLVELVGSGGFNSTSPANPNSNWSNGALGYFGALAMSELEATAQ